MDVRTQLWALRADFDRSPSATTRLTLTVWRAGAWAHTSRTPLGWSGRRITVVDFVWTRSVIGAELPRSVRLGPGIELPHAGRGSSCTLSAPQVAAGGETWVGVPARQVRRRRLEPSVTKTAERGAA